MAARLDGCEGENTYSFAYMHPENGDAVGSLLINGKKCAETIIDVMPLMTNSSCFAVGKFPRVAVTDSLRNKALFNYTNDIEKVVFDTAPDLSELEQMWNLNEQIRRD